MNSTLDSFNLGLFSLQPAALEHFMSTYNPRLIRCGTAKQAKPDGRQKDTPQALIHAHAQVLQYIHVLQSVYPCSFTEGQI